MVTAFVETHAPLLVVHVCVYVCVCVLLKATVAAPLDKIFCGFALCFQEVKQPEVIYRHLLMIVFHPH